MGAVWSAIRRTEQERVGESEPRLVNDQPAETTSTLVIYKDKMQDNELTRIQLEGPLTTQREASQRKLFVIKFPAQGDDVAYLDTLNYSIRFRGEPITQDTSILMEFKPRRRSVMDHEYSWETPILSQHYYMVTDNGGELRGSKQIKFSQSSPDEIPTWRVRSKRAHPTMLSFRQTVDDREFYPEPIATEDAKLVLGVATEVTGIEVYVTNFDIDYIPAEMISNPFGAPNNL